MLTGRSAWVAPVIIGCLALAVRLLHLDRVAHIDELYHLLAAQGWLAEGRLRIAEGIYDNAALFTIYLAQWLQLFGDSLVVLRLPSVLAGTALVVAVFLWTRSVAGTLAAALAGLLLALDPEAIEISQFARFYALHCLLFWLGAIGIYRLVTSPPAAPGRTLLLAAGCAFCITGAMYLQLTTLIGLAGLALWAAATLGLPWLAERSPRVRWAVVAGLALAGILALWVLAETGIAARFLRLYTSTPLFQAENRDAFWFYHSFLEIYYPSLWPLVALAVVIGLAYRPVPTTFCACIFVVAFLGHSFAGRKSMRYFSYAMPFLFVLWGIALAEVWPRLRPFLEEVGMRTLAWLRLGWLGRAGIYGGLAVVLLFVIAANGAFVRTATTMAGIVIPPVRKPADWVAAGKQLQPWVADADIVLTTSELHALYYLGRYDFLISKSRLSELGDAGEFTIDHRTGRSVIGQPGSLATIMDCYAEGLIVTSADRWRNPAQLDDALANLIVVRAEEIDVPAYGMRAYLWHQTEDAGRAEACARLDDEVDGQTMARLERSHAQ